MTAPDDRGPLLAGALVVLLVFGGFGTWSFLAPLSSAAVAAGEVRVESHRKSVQHLEGGIIREILVHNGDIVEENQVLVRLDTVSTTADLTMYTAQHNQALAAKIRLIAERTASALLFPDDLRDSEFAHAQQAIYDSRRHAIAIETDIYTRRIGQLNAEIDGYKAQIVAHDRAAVLLQEEIKDRRYLNDKGLEIKFKLLEIERLLASTIGSRAQALADIAKANQSIGEAEVNILKLSTDYGKEIAKDLRDTEEHLSDADARMRKAREVLSRAEIVAPHAGKVVNLKQFTLGGVLRPGDMVLEIVPQRDSMIVECHIDPKDIVLVHAGLPAAVRLSGYKQRRTPTVQGIVTKVAADVQVDDKQSPAKSFYVTEVEIDVAQLAALPDIRLYQGMPAEVMIETSVRTAFAYFTDPIRDSFWRSFREN